jgi:hypothetical protein
MKHSFLITRIQDCESKLCHCGVLQWYLYSRNLFYHKDLQLSLVLWYAFVDVTLVD